MLFCKTTKDGGSESKVWGFFVVEMKKLFSIVALHFLDGSREAYHNHAFNSISWVLKGKLEEHMIDGVTVNTYTPSLKPIITKRSSFHRVISEGDTYVISFRGPWVDEWKEFIPGTGIVKLTHSRKVIA